MEDRGWGGSAHKNSSPTRMNGVDPVAYDNLVEQALGGGSINVLR